MTLRELRRLPMRELLDRRQEVALARASLAPLDSGAVYLASARREMDTLDRAISERMLEGLG